MSNDALEVMDEFEEPMDDEMDSDLSSGEDVQEESAVRLATSNKGSKKKAKGSADKSVDLEYIGSKEESAETRSIASRAKLRSQMEADVDAYLQKGGKIKEIEPNVMADPPRKPVSNYGSRPI